MTGSEILELGPIVLAGFSFFGDPLRAAAGWTEENEIGLLWKRFTAAEAALKEIFPDGIDSRHGYEVHVFGPETDAKGWWEVFVGRAVTEPRRSPHPLTGTMNLPMTEPVGRGSERFLIKILPRARYALFTLKGREIIGGGIDRIYSETLPERRLVPLSWMIERYDERFRGLGDGAIDGSELDILVPAAEGPRR